MPNKTIDILIVDDNKNNLFTLHTLIEEYLDANILEANSGMDALSIILTEKVDLVILDVQMPEMDGFETAQAIRDRKKTQHIPIVFLTAAYKSDEFQQKGFSVGAADYLTKPIDKPQLIARIKSYIRFIEQDYQHKQELEHKVEERTAKLSETNQLLNKEISERKQIEDALQTAKEAAEAANIAKSQFLANMSHELRTPLNAIIGYSEMLTEDAEDAEQNDFIPDLQKIRAAGKHLLGLINDVLDLSKIESGKMELFIENVDLQIILDEVKGTVQPLMEKKENLFKMELSDSLGKMQTDMTKLRQILLNLLSNAAKFTEKGIVHLKIKRQTRQNRDWIIFCVVDDGIGMTEAQQEKLFQPFTQADVSTTRRYGGTGLGLSITKQFTEMMGGSIYMNSKFGNGCTFSIDLPAQVDTAQIEDASETQPSDLSKEENIILIIDDDAVMCHLLKDDLTKLGYAVVMAANGDEGIDLAYKRHPNTILLNVQMSGMEGWRVLSALKNDAFFALVRVILIVMDADSNQWYAMDATDCLDKAAVRTQLAVFLEKYLVNEDSTGSIMVVEDDMIWRGTMTHILENQGWRVLQADNGQVALEELKDQEFNEQPKLILLDLNMPVMDGFEFITHLRNDEKNCSIPTVVLTSRNLSAEEQVHLNQSVKFILRKETYTKNELAQHIHQMIANTR